MGLYEVYKEEFEGRMEQLSKVHLTDKDVDMISARALMTDDVWKVYVKADYNINSDDISTRTKNQFEALKQTIYMALMGKQGIREAAQIGCDGAHYLHDKLLATGHFTDAFKNKEYLNEFCVRYDGDLDQLQTKWLKAGILGGVKIDDRTVMLAVTEQRSREEIDALVELVKS